MRAGHLAGDGSATGAGRLPAGMSKAARTFGFQLLFGQLARLGDQRRAIKLEFVGPKCNGIIRHQFVGAIDAYSVDVDAIVGIQILDDILAIFQLNLGVTAR